SHSSRFSIRRTGNTSSSPRSCWRFCSIACSEAPEHNCTFVHCIPEHCDPESLPRGVSLDQWCDSRRTTMATATLNRTAAKGGSFLLESPAAADVFTPADLTDDQKLIGQTAEEFVVKEVLPAVKDLENKKPGLMARLVRKGAEVGLMGGGGREEFGGAGLDKIATTVLTEKLSIYGGFAVTHGAHAGIGTLPIVYFGTEAQKKKYLPKLASAELIGAYCLSEPQAGSDAQNSLTRAVLNPEGTHYILNGQKMWITNGGFADLYVVFAKIEGEKFSAFIRERAIP